MSDTSFVVCPICLEALHARPDDQAALPCGHVYHNSCLTNWMRQSEAQSNCPQCRHQFQPSGILRLHFSTSDNGSLLYELREELRVTKNRLKDTETSCAVVLEQSSSEQAKLKEQLHRARSHSQQEFLVSSADIRHLSERHQLQRLREELRNTQRRLHDAETSCAAVLEQSTAQQARLTEALRQAHANAAAVVEEALAQQSRLQEALRQAQANAAAVLEQSAAEQSRLMESLRHSRTCAASSMEAAAAEQSRLQETLREAQAGAAALLEESVAEQVRLKAMLRRRRRRQEEPEGKKE